MSGIPIENIAGKMGAGEAAKTKSVQNENSGKFDSVINEAMNRVSQVQSDVDKAVSELATGGDITTAVLAIEKADMSFQLMTEVRNKLISTYQEIMRMQV